MSGGVTVEGDLQALVRFAFGPAVRQLHLGARDKGRDDGCQNIDQAQLAKYEHICRKLHLRPGDRLVDIGCGWGGMLAHAAAHYGVEGVGYTLSIEQHAYAERRLKDLGLHLRVRVELADYREVRGEFDKFVSIGMFEHVGKEYFGIFFKKAGELRLRSRHTPTRSASASESPSCVCGASTSTAPAPASSGARAGCSRSPSPTGSAPTFR